MSELDDLRRQLSDLEAQKAQADLELKTIREQSEKTAKKLSELEAQNKVLIEEKERAEIAANEAEVKVLCEEWIAQGVPPVLVDKTKPILLNRHSRVIKLSDDNKDDIPLSKFFGEFFDAMPKIPMTQISFNEAPSIELSDVDKAKEHAKAIAKSIR